MTISSLEILYSVDGDQTGEAYSRTDLTIDIKHVFLIAFTVTHYYQFLSRDKGCTKGWACKCAPQNNSTYKVQNSIYMIQHRQVQKHLSKKESAEVQHGQFVVGYL